MTTATFINAHKILVAPVVLFLMYYFDNWSIEAFIYLSIHGTYSLLWLLKHQIYPDVRFNEKQPLLVGILFIFLPLAGYYIAPYILISKHIQLSPLLIGIVIMLYTLGIFMHYVSDAQKHYTLQYKKGLIDNGLFSRTRNPNYLGEIMIYIAYATMSLHWLPFVVLSGWVFAFFIRNMIAKDKSLSRHPGFSDYKKKTWLLFPKILK